ncbi:MAG: hypothetical protein PUF10_02700 [Bacteroidales bacterium]|nr:hypothetical protein [Bacteroidales bacterium]
MERKIGDIFRVGDGVRLQVVEAPDNICDGCHYEASSGHSTCTNVKGGECRFFLRSDNKNIIFKVISKKAKK